MKNIFPNRKGISFLIIVSSFIWFMVGINNISDGLIYLFICSIVLGFITAIVLAILFLFMKHVFNW